MIGLLPPLREDLHLKQSEVDHMGRLSWIIHDPSRNRFFSLDWLSSELLKRWCLRDADKVLASVNFETTLDADEQDIQDLAAFLERNELLQVYAPQATDRLQQRFERSKPGVLKGLLKHYLYLRIPLVNPERLLAFFAPLVRPLGSTWFTRLTLLVLLFGLFQLSRRWDSFIHSFAQVFNLESLIQAGVIVVLVKVLHEFGHAFAAFNRGCRVPRMGVVFLVLFPVAYTDVTDSWKLKPSERVQIGLAGIRVELIVAAWATMIWGLLPPGGVRDGIFLVLTVTWIGTLLINASPFMRFDGYFVLMDLWRLPNLHQRSAALGRWWMRKTLLGSTQPAPEYLAESGKRLIAFAYITWIYRLVVFLGIAWLVYTLFPQPFGLILALLELVWFILLPVHRELKHWPAVMRESFKRPQLWFSLVLVLCMGIAIFYPWRESISLQVVLAPSSELIVESKEPAQLVALKTEEGRVQQGELLAQFVSPELQYELDKLDVRRQRLEWMLGQTSFVAELLASESELRGQLDEINEQQRSIQQRIEDLSIRAPITAYYVPSEKQPGENDWVPANTEFGVLYSEQRAARGYLTASERYWLASEGTILWNSSQSETVALLTNDRVSLQAVEIVEEPLLLKAAGGELSARLTKDGWVPDETLYQFSAQVLDSEDSALTEEIGLVELSARPHSYWMLVSEVIKRQVRQDFGASL